MRTLSVGPITLAEYESARSFLRVGGWKDHRVQDIESLLRLLAQSSVSLVAGRGDQIVGFIRALTDGRSKGCISMFVAA